MKNVKLYVEGGGDSKEQHVRCREGFRKLLEKSGFSEKLPRIIAGGGREGTFDQFKTAVRSAASHEYPILLVDSEDPISNENITTWAHLKARDNWDRPDRTADDQAQLMVTCMETWIMADRAALQAYFGTSLHANSLLPLNDLEARQRDAVLAALENASRDCKKPYRKGKRSFEMLAGLDPETLKKYLPHFVAFLDALREHL